MATIVVYNQEREPLEGVSVFIFNSTGKKIGGLSTNSSGKGNILDSLLVDKNGKLEITRVGYDPTIIKIDDFRGVAYMKRKEEVIGDVLIVRKKTKPFVIKNPFEQGIPEPTQTKNKKNIGLIVGGGFLLGLLSILVVKSVK
jgi:hypothetical protein